MTTATTTLTDFRCEALGYEEAAPCSACSSVGYCQAADAPPQNET